MCNVLLECWTTEAAASAQPERIQDSNRGSHAIASHPRPPAVVWRENPTGNRRRAHMESLKILSMSTWDLQFQRLQHQLQLSSATLPASHCTG